MDTISQGIIIGKGDMLETETRWNILKPKQCSQQICFGMANSRLVDEHIRCARRNDPGIAVKGMRNFISDKVIGNFCLFNLRHL